MNTLLEIVKSLPTDVLVRSIPVIALLIVIFWLMKFLTSLLDGIHKNTEAINNLTTVVEVMGRTGHVS
jgi:hypothetical protein